MGDVRCLGCGVTVADCPGPTHAYMLSTPGCWALYASLEDWKATLFREQAVSTVHHLVDSYAAQHPDNLDRRNRQSVAVHLMSLCASLEHGVPGERLGPLVGSWTHREYPQLLPRPEQFAVTVGDVAAADETDRPAAASDWASATWSAWSDHHDEIRAWLAGVTGGAQLLWVR